MPSNFVHLHCHSEYSLLDGAIKVEKLVGRAKDLDMSAVALTDHGNMFGAVKFYRTCRRENIKPVLGMEAYVTRGNRWDKQRKKGELGRLNHLILIARNNTGYQNLMKLSSIGFLEGFYYKPRIDWEALEQHSDGLICTSACLKGDIAQTLLHEDATKAKERVARYQELFGEDNYYLEIMDHGIEDETTVKKSAVELGRQLGVKVIATNDAHYLTREHAEAHEVLMCLQTGSDFDDPKRFRFRSSELYFKTPDEMVELFGEVPETLTNTMEIAEKTDVTLDEKTFHLPNFPLPEQYASNLDYLTHLAFEGARERYPEVTEEIRERLQYELSVIEKMGYEGYFLIVRDIVNYAKENDLPVGPGRGSAAGSLLCYVLQITDVDPIAQGLIFERMLNPERVSMPDIDIDFCFERRDEVIKYVIDRYGKDNVCQIITFGTMAARGVVKDVSRVLGISFQDADRIAKLIPGAPGTSLEESIRNVPELKRLSESDAIYRRLMDLCLKLEGMTRHASIHAAGMIITPTPLTNHLPLYRTNKGEVTSQYDMKSAEAVGLLKIDVLGLRTLTVIDKAVRMARRNHGVDIDPANIPMDDAKTFELLREGRTVGVFQLESSGMRELLRSMQPESFSDIVAVNALYRPGPLDSGMDKTFVNCKHGRQEIEYPDASLEPILNETYGVILYQEQVMQIAGKMAGFSMGGADLLRKAMGKKDSAVMQEQRKKFVEGAQQNGFTKQKATKIFDLMEKFARYGFNKSHSAAYAVVSVRTAYLKANYPAEFMAANLTSEMHDTDRILTLLDDTRMSGISVLPPDVNQGDVEFQVVDGKILFGLAAVKNVGVNAVRQAVSERAANGPFKSLFDFCSRISSRLINRRAIESLVYAGAFDCLPGNRREKIESLERIMEQALKSSRDAERGQFGLFANDESFMDDDLERFDDYSDQEKLGFEKEALGFYLSGHPLDRFKSVIRMMSTISTADLKTGANGKHAVIGGLVSNVKTTLDKKNNEMAFVTLEDKDGQAEALMFSDVFSRSKAMVTTDRVLLFEGKVSSRGGEGKLLVNSVTLIDDDRPPVSKEMHLSIDLDRVAADKIDEVKQVLARNHGESQVFLHIKEGGKKSCVVRSKSLSVNIGYDMLGQLSDSLGPDNIRLVRGGTLP